jgi:hypothetical protein
VWTERTPLDPGLERRLRAEFKPEVRALQSLIGRDLAVWLA